MIMLVDDFADFGFPAVPIPIIVDEFADTEAGDGLRDLSVAKGSLAKRANAPATMTGVAGK